MLEKIIKWKFNRNDYFDKINISRFKDIPNTKSMYYIGIGNDRINETKINPSS